MMSSVSWVRVAIRAEEGAKVREAEVGVFVVVHPKLTDGEVVLVVGGRVKRDGVTGEWRVR